MQCTYLIYSSIQDHCLICQQCSILNIWTNWPWTLSPVTKKNSHSEEFLNPIHIWNTWHTTSNKRLPIFTQEHKLYTASEQVHHLCCPLESWKNQEHDRDNLLIYVQASVFSDHRVRHTTINLLLWNDLTLSFPGSH